MSADDPSSEAAPAKAAVSVLDLVTGTIEDRKAGRGMTNEDGKSYVRRLLDGGAPKLREKIAEEAEELGDALENESDARVVSEAADLLFHVMVGLAHRDLELAHVAEALRARMGLSGIDEKAQR